LASRIAERRVYRVINLSDRAGLRVQGGEGKDEKRALGGPQKKKKKKKRKKKQKKKKKKKKKKNWGGGCGEKTSPRIS